MITEVWKDIPGFENRYQASTLGRIKSIRFFKSPTSLLKHKKPFRELIMAQDFSHDYYRVMLTKEYKQTERFQVHRLILLTFRRPPCLGEVGNHLDGNSKNNTLSNLEWTTPEKNVEHRIKIGKYLTQSGESQYNSKLTEKDVLKMRQLYKDGWSGVDLGKKFGTNATNALLVAKGKSWKHLPL